MQLIIKFSIPRGIFLPWTNELSSRLPFALSPLELTLLRSYDKFCFRWHCKRSLINLPGRTLRLSKSPFKMLMNEKMYQKLAAMVAEKLRRADSSLLARPGPTPENQFDSPSLLTPQSQSSQSHQSSQRSELSRSSSNLSASQKGRAHAARSLSPSFDSPSLLTPQSQSSQSHQSSQRSELSRSSSNLSASSFASLGDGESQFQLDDDKDFDDEEAVDIVEASDESFSDVDEQEQDGGYDNMSVHTRGSRAKYSVEDRTLVTVPVLQLIDASLLAPIPSILYKTGALTKSGNIKKYEEFDFDTFKDIIKETIRKLASQSDGPNIYQRLFWASYDVVRKRRANHNQSWRLYGYPKDLVYGGKKQFIAKYGNPWAERDALMTRKRRRRRRKKPKVLSFDDATAKIHASKASA